MLGSLGGLEGAEVADLFAGSGAMGIEALSRGASRATFVENDRGAVSVIEQNLAATGLGPAEVRCSDVMMFLRHGAGSPVKYDIVFCDPPYRFEGWSDLLLAVPGDLVVAESDSSVGSLTERPLIRSRRYGSTVVDLLGPVEPKDRHVNKPPP